MKLLSSHSMNQSFRIYICRYLHRYCYEANWENHIFQVEYEVLQDPEGFTIR